MIGKTNSTIYTSGGIIKPQSSILVWYPSSYTCTCTHDGEMITAEDTSGYWVFRVSEIGEYLIEVDEEANCDSRTVVVTDYGTIQCVRLLPNGWFYPIHNGTIANIYTYDYHSNLASGTSSYVPGTGPTINAAKASSSWIEGYLNEPIHLEKGMSKMVVTYTGKGYMLTVGLKTDVSLAYTSVSGNFVVYNDGGRNTQRTNYTVTLDISEMVANAVNNNTSYYFAFRTAGSGGNYTGTMTIYDLYFE